MKTINTVIVSTPNIQDEQIFKYYVSVQDLIVDILSTPKGSRVMLPDYGSDLHKLIDKRIDDEWKLDLNRYVFEAIQNCEPRVKEPQVRAIEITQDGQIRFDLTLANLGTLKVLQDGY